MDDKSKPKVRAICYPKCNKKINNNINITDFGSKQNGHSVCRSCETTELVKNGGFEIAGVAGEIDSWITEENNVEIERAVSVPYEGVSSALFRSLSTEMVEEKKGRLFQNITVTPGCLYELSFAANFLLAGTDLDFLRIRARVFYGDVNTPENQVNLIKIDINYPQFAFKTDNKGYVFYQRVADKTVPCNVSNVTVEYSVELKDEGDDPETLWFLDDVSLRAITEKSVRY